jgi:hypothetical protein
MEFRLLQKDQSAYGSMIAASPTGAGANVAIELLPDQMEDENGRPKWFNVVIR